MYLILWYVAALFEYAHFASLWYAPAGLTVAIIMLWRNNGFGRVLICVFCISVLTQYSYFDDPDIFKVISVSIFAAVAHAVPYWLALKLFKHTQFGSIKELKAELLRPILFAVFLLFGALGAALFGILVQMIFADMSLDTAKSIWLGWWLGDYVGAIVLAPFFILVVRKYFSGWIAPEDSFLLTHSQNIRFMPSSRLSFVAWSLIILLPSTVAYARVDFDNRIPEILAFLLALLPIAILSTRNTWSVLVSASVLSSIGIIITVKHLGLLGNAISYQATLLAIAVTSLFFYDLVKSFELRSQELVDTEQSLSTASKLLTLNELGANIAHEINTPLQTILLSSQSVLRRLAKRDGDWSIETIELNHIKDAVAQASKTVKTVHNLVKTQSPKDSFCNIKDALLLAFRLSESTAKTHGVEVQMENMPDFVVVKIDQNELTQILLILISNGIRSAAESAAKKVQVGFDLSNELHVSIEVADSGSGVAESEQHNLFKLGHSKSNDGLGIGLWVGRSIAERQGGSLEYISNSENWCFQLILLRL